MHCYGGICIAVDCHVLLWKAIYSYGGLYIDVKGLCIPMEDDVWLCRAIL